MSRSVPHVMHGGEDAVALPVAEPGGLFGRAGEIQPLDDHRGAVRPGAVSLHEGRALGHHDGHRHAQPGAVIGEGLGMVPRAGRHHAAFALVRRQLQQPVQGPALLEAAGEMQVVELDPDLGAGQLRQPPRIAHGRAVDLAGDAVPRRQNVVKRDCHGTSLYPVCASLMRAFGPRPDAPQP